jgi:oligogalacturonide lyase
MSSLRIPLLLALCLTPLSLLPAADDPPFSDGVNRWTRPQRTFGLQPTSDEPPTDWIDPDTGHRIIRLSREPGSASLYFHQNSYTPDGSKLIITTPSGISTVDLKTREIKPVVEGKVGVLVVGRKTGRIYYTKGEDKGMVVYAADVETRESKEIARLPRGTVSSLNADETLLLGSEAEGAPQSAQQQTAGAPSADAKLPVVTDGPQPTGGVNPDTGKPLTFAEQKEVRLNTRLEQRVPMTIFTVSTRNGEVKTVYQSTDWLNHLQFSPTDPDLIMFCHEGPWHKVDRIWTIRADGTQLTKIHARTMNMEIAGHEFFSRDGKIIWYDLQTPRGEDFWVAGCELATGHRTWYHLQRDEWSVHFNVSPDGALFCGDGGDEEMVAHAKNGKWLYLFRPQTIPDVAGIKAANSENLIHPGVFQAERLVNMAKHDYKLEPNLTFTPDMKWLVFRSNMFGPTHVFAVEAEKAK